jgi:16S rRNA C967 or C1407 C5-methylase (RsmB/RsmF family)
LTADLVAIDALKYEPEELFDAILLDAPCTATGTCRRHPDVLHRIGRARSPKWPNCRANCWRAPLTG